MFSSWVEWFFKFVLPGNMDRNDTICMHLQAVTNRCLSLWVHWATCHYFFMATFFSPSGSPKCLYNVCCHFEIEFHLDFHYFGCLGLCLTYYHAEASSSKEEMCSHPGSFGSMCIRCGQMLDGESGVTFGYIHKVQVLEILKVIPTILKFFLLFF